MVQNNHNKNVSAGDLMHLLHLVKTVNVAGLSPEAAKQLIFLQLNLNAKDKASLHELYKGLETIFDAVSTEIANFYLSEDEGEKMLNMHQPKYKLSTCASLLGVTRATLNNWTNNKGGYLRTFEAEGVAKYVLEEDLIAKYQEVFNKEIVIDDDFRLR